MVFRGRFEAELLEDQPDVSLDGLGTEEQRLADRLIGTSLGHQPEDISLPVGELAERRRARAAHQPGDDRRVDDALAVGDPLQRFGEHSDIGNPLFEQVPDAFGDLGEQLHRVPRLEVVGEDEHTDLGVVAPNLLGGDDALIGVCRRHLDVDDDGIRSGRTNHAQQLSRILRRADNLEPGARQKMDDALADEHRVISDDYPHAATSHGRAARMWTDETSVVVTSSRPPIAPTRSCSSTSASGTATASNSMTRTSS